MESSRRDFLKTLVAGTAVGLIASPGTLLASEPKTKLTILHTNDTHSRIEPRAKNDSREPGYGGYARRAGLINKIREEEQGVLLFDAGDYFQGTPYFNVYGGEAEIKLMSQMGYDAVTMGNHEFDNGLEGFNNVYPHANFPFVSSNYDFSETILDGKIKKYHVIKHKGVRVGVYGLGVMLDGLVSPISYGKTRYLDPLKTALEMEQFLKEKKKCSLIVCLSHLGFDSEEINDQIIGCETFFTDIIIGGHTHTLLDPPVKVKNKSFEDVTICQTGYGGVRLGRIDFWMGKRSGKKFVEGYTTNILNKQ